MQCDGSEGFRLCGRQRLDGQHWGWAAMGTERTSRKDKCHALWQLLWRALMVGQLWTHAVCARSETVQLSGNCDIDVDE